MIRNVEDLYRYFLAEIKKEGTHTVVPSMFNLIINAALLNWVKEKLPLNEFKQIRIEDLNVLLVNGEVIQPSGENNFLVPDDALYNIRAVFDVDYINSTCFEDGTGIKKVAKLVKLDRMSALLDNYYTKPKDHRLYYSYLNKMVELYTGKISELSDSVGVQMHLDYYKYPDTIEFVEGGDNASDLQFKPLQLQEIGAQAVQEFLERNKDPRYQSYLNEQIQRKRI